MILNREPIAIVNAVRLVALAAIAFGLTLTDVQLVASMAALEAVLTLFARSQVVPVETHDEQVEMAGRLRTLGDPGRTDLETALLVGLAAFGLVMLLLVLI